MTEAATKASEAQLQAVARRLDPLPLKETAMIENTPSIPHLDDTQGAAFEISRMIREGLPAESILPAALGLCRDLATMQGGPGTAYDLVQEWIEREKREGSVKPVLMRARCSENRLDRYEAEEEIIELRGAMADALHQVRAITRRLYRERFSKGA